MFIFFQGILSPKRLIYFISLGYIFTHALMWFFSLHDSFTSIWHFFPKLIVISHAIFFHTIHLFVFFTWFHVIRPQHDTFRFHDSRWAFRTVHMFTWVHVCKSKHNMLKCTFTWCPTRDHVCTCIIACEINEFLLHLYHLHLYYICTFYSRSPTVRKEYSGML